MTKADTYNPLALEEDKNQEFQFDQSIWNNNGVWQEFVELRASGQLLALGKQIKCPVVAIHGDYDSHPPEGIQKPLASILKEFHFIPLKNCGHEPWREKEARKEFFKVLYSELSV